MLQIESSNYDKIGVLGHAPSGTATQRTARGRRSASASSASARRRA